MVEDFERNDDFLRKAHHVLFEVIFMRQIICSLEIKVVPFDQNHFPIFLLNAEAKYECKISKCIQNRKTELGNM